MRPVSPVFELWGLRYRRPWVVSDQTTAATETDAGAVRPGMDLPAKDPVAATQS